MAIPDSFAALSQKVFESKAMEFGLWQTSTDGHWIRAKLVQSPHSEFRIFCICGQCESKWNRLGQKIVWD